VPGRLRLVDVADARQNPDRRHRRRSRHTDTTDAAVQLGNRGDAIVLVDHTGASIDHVAFKADKVRTGRTICFGR
jgi:hypothetical protein